jgi:hypothetical protein
VWVAATFSTGGLAGPNFTADVTSLVLPEFSSRNSNVAVLDFPSSSIIGKFPGGAVNFTYRGLSFQIFVSTNSISISGGLIPTGLSRESKSASHLCSVLQLVRVLAWLPFP